MPIYMMLFLTLLGGVGFENPEGAVARFIRVEDAVLFHREKTQWMPAQQGKALFDFDQVRTGSRGKTEILFADQTVLKIHPSSNLLIRRKEETNIFMATGKLFAHVIKGKKPLYIKTPTATLGVTGTKFTVEVRKEKETVLYVHEGSILFTSPEDVDFSNAIKIEAGFCSLIKKGEEPIHPWKLSEGTTPPW